MYICKCIYSYRNRAKRTETTNTLAHNLLWYALRMECWTWIMAVWGTPCHVKIFYWYKTFINRIKINCIFGISRSQTVQARNPNFIHCSYPKCGATVLHRTAIITRLMNSIEVFPWTESLTSQLAVRKWSQSNTLYTDPVVVRFYARFGSFLSHSLSLSQKGDSSLLSSNITANQIHFETFKWYCFLLSRWDNRTFDTRKEMREGRYTWEGYALKCRSDVQNKTTATITSTATTFSGL